MTRIAINELIERFSEDPEEAWAAFLGDYAASVFEVVRHIERDHDNSSDCFQFVCEQLVKDSFRRLRKFRPDGPATFSTWLRAVVRNLCLDWRRKQFGRPRAFRSISRLSDSDQAIFHCIHEQGLSIAETHATLKTRFPQLTLEAVSDATERISHDLTSNQRWLLKVRSADVFHSAGATHSGATTEREPADPQPNPEAEAIMNENRALVMRALKRLPGNERLAVRLRFEENLTLNEIANLLDLGNAQRADRHIKEILFKLRREIESLAGGPQRGNSTTSSVKAM